MSNERRWESNHSLAILLPPFFVLGDLAGKLAKLLTKIVIATNIKRTESREPHENVRVHRYLRRRSLPRIVLGCHDAGSVPKIVPMSATKSQAAAILGRIGGKSTSPEKIRAAKENGKLGGRPPKRKLTKPQSVIQKNPEKRLDTLNPIG
jgi:hypothetical protein